MTRGCGGGSSSTGIFAALVVTLACGLMGFASALGQALPTFQPPRFETPRPLAQSTELPVVRHEKSGTAFFVDDFGHMLTARHAAEDCVRIVVAKEGRAAAASVVALSSQSDLALINAPRTWGLSAVFPHSVMADVNEMVFAASYDALPGMIARSGMGGMIANGYVTSGNVGNDAGEIAIDSAVSFGASGAPVLDGRGLVQGIISRRTAANRVVAVGAAQAKAFLRGNGIRIDEDDRPQLAGSASRANRAASISARVTCLQN
jgi:S1-C subfamily serine protease